MTDLVSLYGQKKNRVGQSPYSFSLFSLSGNGKSGDPILDANPLDLSDVDAGIQVLYALVKARPGITWAGLAASARGGNKVGWGWGWLRDAGKFIGQGVSDIGDKLGEWGGDTVRLLTDEQVSDSLKTYGAAYMTGGQSLGVEGMLQKMGGTEGGFSLEKLWGFLGGLGKESIGQVQKAGFNSDFSNVDPKVWMIGGGVIGAIVLILMVAKK